MFLNPYYLIQEIPEIDGAAAVRPFFTWLVSCHGFGWKVAFKYAGLIENRVGCEEWIKQCISEGYHAVLVPLCNVWRFWNCQRRLLGGLLSCPPSILWEKTPLQALLMKHAMSYEARVFPCLFPMAIEQIFGKKLPWSWTTLWLQLRFVAIPGRLQMDCHPGGDFYFLGFTTRIIACSVGDSKLKRNVPTMKNANNPHKCHLQGHV